MNTCVKGTVWYALQPVATFALVFFLRIQYSIGVVTDNIFADKCLSFNLNSKTCLKSYAKFIKKENTNRISIIRYEQASV